jgi:hypothetical protein
MSAWYLGYVLAGLGPLFLAVAHLAGAARRRTVPVRVRAIRAGAAHHPPR